VRSRATTSRESFCAPEDAPELDRGVPASLIHVASFGDGDETVLLVVVGAVFGARPDPIRRAVLTSLGG
jgi:hypothetical protein